MKTCPECKKDTHPSNRICTHCGYDYVSKTARRARVSFVLSDWLDDMRRRVERAEDAILNATTKREKDHATIRYETVRDILSAYERKAAMSSNAELSDSRPL